MPINPFDEKNEFTCPRCGSHDFMPSGQAYTVACNGEVVIEGVKRICQYTYFLKPDPAPKEAATIRVGRWWRHRNSTTIVRVFRVQSWPSWETGEADHQEVYFETSDGTKRQDCLLDTLFLEFYRPHSQPGNEHGQEEIKTDSRDAATIAFDEIVKICDVPTWDYPGQVIRDVRMLKDQRDDSRKAAGIHADLNAQLSRDLQSTQVDRDDALDLISAVVDQCPPESCAAVCPWCETYDKSGSLPHAIDCKAALLLRKHGRKVRFQGET